MLKLKTREKPFPELSYANPRQPALTRWVIHSIEGLSGRDRYAALYDFWRRQVAPTGERVFSRMLELIDVKVRSADQWPWPFARGPARSSAFCSCRCQGSSA